jgi:GGDEF domain-containing protein
VARLGGDEFVLLLGDLLHAEDVAPLLDRVLHDVAQPIQVSEEQSAPDIHVNISVSAGVTLFPQGQGHAR